MRTALATAFLAISLLTALAAWQHFENRKIRRELLELRAATLDYWRNRTDATAGRLADQLLATEEDR